MKRHFLFAIICTIQNNVVILQRLFDGKGFNILKKKRLLYSLRRKTRNLSVTRVWQIVFTLLREVLSAYLSKGFS